MEKVISSRELRKSLIELREQREMLQKMANRRLMSDNEKQNYFKSFYILTGKIKQLEVIIAKLELDECGS